MAVFLIQQINPGKVKQILRAGRNPDLELMALVEEAWLVALVAKVSTPAARPQTAPGPRRPLTLAKQIFPKQILLK